MKFHHMNYIFQWIVISLACYRIQRIVTTDDWPPSLWFRKKMRFNAYLLEFFSCPWCFGTWATWAIFALSAQFVSVPLPVFQALAGSAVVGYLGQRDS